MSEQPLIWKDVSVTAPPIRKFWSDDKPYVLAVDARGRMSIGYATAHSSVPFIWTFAKPIGEPTHWMELPQPPQPNKPRGGAARGQGRAVG